jgi:hypothetical protein
LIFNSTMSNLSLFVRDVAFPFNVMELLAWLVDIQFIKVYKLVKFGVKYRGGTN